VDRWLEDDEEETVHPRDPYHRLEIRDTSRRVEVALAGETLAVSVAPLVLFETSLPARWYFAPEEITAQLTVNQDARTGAPTRVGQPISTCEWLTVSRPHLRGATSIRLRGWNGFVGVSASSTNGSS
jgi:hypothetical protein